MKLIEKVGGLQTLNNYRQELHILALYCRLIVATRWKLNYINLDLKYKYIQKGTGIIDGARDVIGLTGIVKQHPALALQKYGVLYRGDDS